VRTFNGDVGHEKMNVKRVLKWIAISFGVLLLLGIVGVFAIAYFIFPHETHRLGRYRDLRQTWQPELVAHFPDAIPQNAEKPRLSFFPGFLQGGAHFQVRYGLPAGEIAGLYTRFSSEKTKSFFGGDTNDHMNQTNGMPTTFFHTGTDDRRDFPVDYEIMIFDPVMTNRPPGFYWNHGRSHGVAISTTRNEIVYWAEAW
jgi:hypothetical protein